MFNFYFKTVTQASFVLALATLYLKNFVFGMSGFLYIFEHQRMPRYLYVTGFIDSKYTRKNKVNLIY